MAPRAWKLANVSAVPKGDRSEEFIVGSFGPISILPVVAKVVRVHCSLAAIQQRAILAMCSKVHHTNMTHDTTQPLATHYCRQRAVIAKGLREQHAL